MGKDKKNAKKPEAGRKSFVGMAAVATLVIILSFLALHFGYFKPQVDEVAQGDPAASSEPGQVVSQDAAAPTETAVAKTQTAPPKTDTAPEITSTSPASIETNPISGLELPADESPITPEDFTKISVGSAASGVGYTAVFNRRGAALAVLRFSEENGDQVTPIFVSTPRNPMDAPELHSKLETLLLLGPPSSLRPWKWDANEHRDVPKDPSVDPFTAFPEQASPFFERIWNSVRDGKSFPAKRHAAFELIGGDQVLNEVRWELSGPATKLADGSATIAYRAKAGALIYTKTFTLTPDFKIACKISIENTGETDVSRQISIYGPTGARQDVVDSYTRHATSLFASTSGRAYSSETIQFTSMRGHLKDYLEESGKDASSATIPADKLYGRDSDHKAHVMMNGISNGYFLAAIGVDYLPSVRYGAAWNGLVGGDYVLGGKLAGEVDDEPNLYATLSFPAISIPVGATASRRAVLYAGPHDKAEVVRAFGADHSEADTVDDLPVGDNASWSEYLSTGWPQFISAPITLLLRFLRSTFGSMGLAILALTIIVRLCMSPLSIRSQKSMQIHGHKMRAVKPKLDEVRAKYKGQKSQDARMLQFQETKAIMKANNVSLVPLGGCLPVVLQFPIFLALYNSVRTSFLLRHEDFLWISDLSRPDALMGAWEHGISWLSFLSNSGFITLNILPIVWASMLIVQQLGQAPPSDPQQAKMQKQMRFIMPLMGVMFYAMPAGFTLYFVMSSLYTFAEVRLVRMYLVAKGLIDHPSKIKEEQDRARVTVEKKA